MGISSLLAHLLSLFRKGDSAEVQIGRLTAAMSKDKGGRPSETLITDEKSFQTKQKQLSDIGLTPQQANRYETLAKHPEVETNTRK